MNSPDQAQFSPIKFEESSPKRRKSSINPRFTKESAYSRKSHYLSEQGNSIFLKKIRNEIHNVNLLRQRRADRRSR